MKALIFLFLNFLLFSFSLSVDPNFYIFLAFGQSNMEGNGKIEEQDQNCPERFKMMSAVNMPKFERTKGNWYTANPPLVREYTNLGVTDYFGREMVKNLPEEITVGTITVAIGGASIDMFDEDKAPEYLETTQDWFKGIAKEYDNNPFRVLVNLGKKAQKDGVIKGILLHQGETNTGDKNWPNNLKIVYDRLIKELGLKAEEVPLLIGEVVDHENGGCCSLHNEIIAQTPDVIPTSYVVSAAGLPCADGAHFTSEGYRKLGARYAQVMLNILAKDNKTK